MSEKNVQLGIIINGPSQHQRSKIKILELNNWFNEKQIVISGDLGISRPEAAIFKQLRE